MNARNVRGGLAASVFAAGLLLVAPQAFAQTCENTCYNDYGSCTFYCDQGYYDCLNGGWWGCDNQRNDCYNQCDATLNSCLSGCGPAEPPPPPPPGDGHALCDGWDRQGDCAYNHIGVAIGAEFRRFGGGGGYHGQSFLTWHPGEFDGFGRFTVADGNVGIISTSPLQGQVALHRWSTQRGFYYSIYYTEHGNDYVYGGIAGYVWPPSTNLGFPLHQFYSHNYGHYYTNFPREIRCQPNTEWSYQGIMAHVNWPAPFAQAFRLCTFNQSLAVPGPCDPFFVERCRANGGTFIPGNCSCIGAFPPV